MKDKSGNVESRDGKLGSLERINIQGYSNRIYFPVKDLFRNTVHQIIFTQQYRFETVSEISCHAGYYYEPD